MLSVTTIATFMAGVNARIVVVGLPEIASYLGANLEEAFWFTQAFMLGSTLVLMLAGRLADLFGRSKVFIAGLATFTAGSLLSGLSRTPTELIASRFVQGMGSGVVSSISLAMVADAAPRDKMGLFISINTVAFRLGSLLGLTLSGVLIQSFGPPSVFLFNVPVGLFAIAWALARLEETHTPKEKPVIDWTGFSLISTFLLALMLALTFAARGPADRLNAIASLALALALGAAFTIVETKSPAPLLDLSIFKIGQFAGGVVAQLLNAVAWGSSSVLLALYLEIVKGLSPATAGITMLPMDAIYLVSGVLSGRLADVYGYQPLVLTGLALSTAGLSVAGLLTPQSGMWQAILAMALIGLGMGLFMTPNSLAIMQPLPPGRRGVGSAVRSIMFNIGFTLSLNVSLLSISAHVPYQLASRLLELEGSVDVVEANQVASFCKGLSSAFLNLAIINASAAGVSYLGGRAKG